MRALRFVLGILLVPVCVAATRAAMALVAGLQPESAALVPPSAWALGAGYAAWLLVYFTLPHPVRTYVLAHELTHALWAWLMGARVHRLRVGKTGGSVLLSKSNAWITLAPYFFPLYTAIVIAAYYGLSLFLNVQAYSLWWFALVGLTWGFHFTFTVTTLLQHQSDIREYGHVFSYTVIYLLNVLGICLWVVLVSALTPRDLLQSLAARTAEVFAMCAQWGRAGWLWIRARM